LIYLISITVFSSIILLLVALLLFVESRVVKKGLVTVIINDEKEKSIKAPAGNTLLSALVSHDIFLPSACGGGGSCGQCKCRVPAGGGDILPTELPHLSRKEKKEHVRLSCQLKIREDLRIEIPPEIFSIRQYHATVVSNRNVATFIKELVLRLDDGETLDFEAGAYVQIDVPEYRDLAYAHFDISDRFKSTWERFNLLGLRAAAEEPVYRAYSLANPPAEKKELMFTIRIATPPPDAPAALPGIGSSFLFGLKPGDRVTLNGPYGDFFVKDTDREMCFVGGGAGMAPMRCHIFHQLKTVGTHRRITFWYGARSLQEMFYEEEFRELEAKNDNFSFFVAFSDPRPEDNWDGMTGFIHQRLYDHYLKDHPDPTEIEYYLCGPPAMLKAVQNMLDDLGVDPEMIAYDSFD
jgi:Na+-transporting NADH:ubiquinone oxidoreductase subunit F